MENLENIKNNNQDLYEKLQKYNCKMTYNNKVVYEGIIKKILIMENIINLILFVNLI